MTQLRSHMTWLRSHMIYPRSHMTNLSESSSWTAAWKRGRSCSTCDLRTRARGKKACTSSHTYNMEQMESVAASYSMEDTSSWAWGNGVWSMEYEVWGQEEWSMELVKEIFLQLEYGVWKNVCMEYGNGGMNLPVFGMGPGSEDSGPTHGLGMYPSEPSSPDTETTGGEIKINQIWNPRKIQN